MIARTLALCLPVALAGCNGLLTIPMVNRLGPEQQSAVENQWRNLLTPVDRLDREMLADAIMLYQLHQNGVDSLRMVSEKALDDGRVIMEIRYDRARPEEDVFLVTYLDFLGFAVRHERYSGDEIRGRFEEFTVALASADDDSAQSDAERATLEAERAIRGAAREARIDAVRNIVEPEAND